MIHKRSYLIPPGTPRLSVAVCFPCASGNCSSVNTLGKMGSVILPLSISEMIFSLLLSGGKSVCCQTLLSQISKGIWRTKQKKKKSDEVSSHCSLKPKISIFQGKLDTTSSLPPPLYHTKQLFLSLFLFFWGGLCSGWCVSTGSVPNKIKGFRKIWYVWIRCVSRRDFPGPPKKAASWGPRQSVCLLPHAGRPFDWSINAGRPLSPIFPPGRRSMGWGGGGGISWPLV